MARFNGVLVEDQPPSSPIEITITGELPVDTGIFDQIGIPQERQQFAIEAFEKASQSPLAQTNPDYPVAFVSRLFQESGFRPDAVGPENTRGRGTAKGIAQMLDSTAAELGVTDVFNPSQSIDGAIQFDINSAKRLSSNGVEPTTENILAAYNAGPGNVIKSGGVPNFTQTTEYVDKIVNQHNPLFAQAFNAGVETGAVQTAQAVSQSVGGRFGGIPVDDVPRETPESQISQGEANLAGFTQNQGLPTTDQQSVVQGALQQLQQGLLLNFGDEASAGIQSGLEFAQSVLAGEPIDITDSFNRNLQTNRQQLQQFQQERPVLSGLAQGTGMALPAVMSGGAVAAPAAAGQAARVAPGLTTRIGESAAIGGAFGGVAAAGEAEQNRLQEFNRGAAGGAALGALVPPAISAGAGVANLVNRARTLVQPPEQTAIQTVERAFRRDDIPINTAVNEARQLGNEAVLADAGGENVRGVIRSLSNLPGPQRQRVNTYLQNRQAGRNERVTDDINNLLADAENFGVVAQDIINIKQIANKPLYDRAYEGSVDITDDIVDLFVLNGEIRPSFQKAIRDARRLSRDEIDNFDRLNFDNLEERLLNRTGTSRGGAEVIVSRKGDLWELSKIETPKNLRGGGLAEKKLNELLADADANGATVALTPSSDFGANKNRLTKWYKRHGFVPNKGSSKDFRTRETFIREPGASRPVVDNSSLGTVDNQLSIREVDYIKRGLDSVIEKNTNALGKVNQKGRVAVAQKKNLLKLASTDDYDIARATASDLFTLEKALQDGTKFLSKDSNLTARQISSLNENQADVFRVGAAKAVQDKILGAADGADAYKRIFGNDLIRGKLKAAFPDTASFNEFARSMKREQIFFDTRQAVQGNSTTAKQLFDNEDLSLLPVNLKEKFVRFVARKAFDQIKAPPEEVAEEIAKILVNPKVNFDDVATQINLLQNKSSGDFKRRLGLVLSAVQAEQQSAEILR